MTMTARVRPPPRAAPSRERLVLTEVLDENGRYDANRFAHYLDWSQTDFAHYLKRNPSTIARHGAALEHQEALASLAAVVLQAEALFGGNLPSLRAWLRTPVRALDGASPKGLILDGQLPIVKGLLDELDSGFAL